MDFLTVEQDVALLWDVLDALRIPAFVVNSGSEIVAQNTTVKQKLFFAPNELQGVQISDVLKTSPPLNIKLLQRASVFEGVCMRKDREVFPCKVTVVPAEQRYIILVEDITNVLKIAKRATQRRRELNTYKALSETLARPTEIKEILNNVLETLVTTLQIDAAWAYLLDEETGHPNLCCAKASSGSNLNNEQALKPYEVFIGKVLSSGKSLLIRDVLEDPRVIFSDKVEIGFRSIAGVPLKVKTLSEEEKVVGVLGVASRFTSRFTSLDMQFLNTVGNHLGVAIENARLIKSLKQKMKQIEIINEITGIVNSSLSIGHIFRIVVSEVKKMIHFDRASITLLEEDRKRLRIFALDTDLKTELYKGRIAPVKGTSAGWVAINRTPWINYDLQKEIHFHYDRLLLKEGIRSTISIPLYKDRPIGTLNLDSTMPMSYTERDLEILLPIAKNLSIALENAMLFEEIYREKRQWEKTFDAITDMVWIEDLNGRVLRVNRTVVEKTGKPELALIQKLSSELLDMLKITHEDKPLCSREAHYMELKGLDGKLYYYWSYPLLDSDGRIFGMVNYLRDVTEQKKLQQRLIMADKLASLGTLVAGIAHEINNPLGIIAGYAQALLDRSEAPELKRIDAFSIFPEYLETINNEIFRCKGILNSLLNFARPSTGEFKEISINNVVKDVLMLIEHKVNRQGKKLVVSLDPCLPEIKGDEGSLKQMFLNLLMNALYFTDKGGIITVRTSQEINLYGRRNVLIEVSDNGKGIDKEIIERVFDPFFTTKPAGEGTGLGLAICHRIVTEHDGTIDLESTAGRGTRFFIRLPVKKGHAR